MRENYRKKGKTARYFSEKHQVDVSDIYKIAMKLGLSKKTKTKSKTRKPYTRFFESGKRKEFIDDVISREPKSVLIKKYGFDSIEHVIEMITKLSWRGHFPGRKKADLIKIEKEYDVKSHPGIPPMKINPFGKNDEKDIPKPDKSTKYVHNRLILKKDNLVYDEHRKIMRKTGFTHTGGPRFYEDSRKQFIKLIKKGTPMNEIKQAFGFKNRGEVERKLDTLFWNKYTDTRIRYVENKEAVEPVEETKPQPMETARELMDRALTLRAIEIIRKTLDELEATLPQAK